MDYLRSGDWRHLERLPVPVGRRLLENLLRKGWIETSGEQRQLAARITPAGFDAVRARTPLSD